MSHHPNEFLSGSGLPLKAEEIIKEGVS